MGELHCRVFVCKLISSSSTLGACHSATAGGGVPLSCQVTLVLTWEVVGPTQMKGGEGGGGEKKSALAWLRTNRRQFTKTFTFKQVLLKRAAESFWSAGQREDKSVAFRLVCSSHNCSSLILSNEMNKKVFKFVKKYSSSMDEAMQWAMHFTPRVFVASFDSDESKKMIFKQTIQLAYCCSYTPILHITTILKWQMIDQLNLHSLFQLTCV